MAADLTARYAPCGAADAEREAEEATQDAVTNERGCPRADTITAASMGLGRGASFTQSRVNPFRNTLGDSQRRVLPLIFWISAVDVKNPSFFAENFPYAIYTYAPQFG